MNFNQYKENVNRYMDDYYATLIQELQKRPESSYPIIFEEEFATMKRYAYSLYKEVFFDLEENLEQFFAENQVEVKTKEMTNALENCSIFPISYEVKNDQRERMIIRSNTVSNTSLSDNSDLSTISNFTKPAISGTVAGAVVGGLLGKSLAVTVLGGVSGGVLACAITYLYLKEQGEQPRNESIINESLEQDEKQETVALIENRKEQMKNTLCSLLNQLEEQYNSIQKDCLTLQ